VDLNGAWGGQRSVVGPPPGLSEWWKMSQSVCGEILVWEQRKEMERDTKFVELGRLPTPANDPQKQAESHLGQAR